MTATTCPTAHVCDATARALDVELSEFRPGIGTAVAWRIEGGELLHEGFVPMVEWCGPVSCGP